MSEFTTDPKTAPLGFVFNPQTGYGAATGGNNPARPTASTITDAQLDALYDELGALREVARGYCPECGRGDAAPTVTDWEQQRQRAEQAEAERDGAYRERAHLVAWLAALHPAVIAPAPDVDEPGWQILYLTSSAYGWQMTWHIHPRDAELFKDVEHVPADDPRAEWDGHSTEQKYNRMRTHVRVVHMNNRLGATSCPVCEGTGRCPSCRTTMRAVETEPKES